MNDYVVLSDEQLFSLLKDNNEAAFNVLFKRYRNKLYYYILRHTKSAEIAEEIVLDIFMKLWKGRELADEIQVPAAFFHKVAYYKAMDFLRTAARHSQLQKLYIDRIEHAGEKTPDDQLIDAEIKNIFLKAINQLPPQRKLIYQLSRDEGLSHEKIAEMLNLSRSTVNNTIVSATNSITEYLKKRVSGKPALTIFLFYFL
ncbi:MAG: sigma-70 family RNA polymerase sigma factor [Ginsengibacter sp.]